MTDDQHTPLTDDRVTVGNLISALVDYVDPETLADALADDLDLDTPVIIRTAAGQYLQIGEITLNAMEEYHRVDEAVIALPARYVILAAEPPKRAS